MKTNKIIEVKHCFSCPFCVLDIDFDSVGKEYYYTCNLIKFLNLFKGHSDYVIGAFSDEIYEKEHEELFPLNVLADCPLKSEEIGVNLKIE